MDIIFNTFDIQKLACDEKNNTELNEQNHWSSNATQSKKLNSIFMQFYSFGKARPQTKSWNAVVLKELFLSSYSGLVYASTKAWNKSEKSQHAPYMLKKTLQWFSIIIGRRHRRQRRWWQSAMRTHTKCWMWWKKIWIIYFHARSHSDG